MTGHLGNRFWRLWTGTGVSSLGDGMVLVGFPLLALTFTRNAVSIAGVTVAAKLPGLVVALPAGALVDRLDRRRLLVGLQVLRFLVVIAVVFAVATKAVDLVVVYGAAFVLGSLTVAYDCAAVASLPSIVPPEQLVRANARLETIYETAQEMLGRGLGGLLFTAARALPFIADAIGYLGSAVLLRGAVPDTPPREVATSLGADLRDGLKWFGQNPLMRLLSAIVAQLAFCQAIVFGLLVLYATQDLHLSKTSYGLLLGISATGNIVGAVAAGRIHSRVGSGWSIVLAGALAAVTYPVLGATKSPVVAGAALTLEAAAITVGIVASLSLRQAIVPTAMQGRVASAHMTLVLAAFPLGSLVGGLLAGGLGIRTTFYIAGGLQIVVVALTSPYLLSRAARPQPLGISNL